MMDESMSHYFLHLFLTGGGFAIGLVCGIAQTDIICKRLDARNIPPSAINSPATPIITINPKRSCQRAHDAVLNSPTTPAVSSNPKISSAYSEQSRQADVADLDSGKSVPMSQYDIVVAAIMTLTGFAVAAYAWVQWRRR